MAEESARDLIDRIKTDYEGFDAAFEVVDFVRSVGERLTAMRERAGLSKTELAAKLGMTPGRVWQMESGTLRHAPSLKNIARWARACEARVELVSAPEMPAGREEAAAHAASGATASLANYLDALIARMAAEQEPIARVAKLHSRSLRPRASVGLDDPDLVAAAMGKKVSLSLLEQAAKGTLRAAGVADVGVAAGRPHVVGDHVELMLTLRSARAKVSAVEHD